MKAKPGAVCERRYGRGLFNQGEERQGFELGTWLKACWGGRELKKCERTRKSCPSKMERAKRVRARKINRGAGHESWLPNARPNVLGKFRESRKST